MKVVFDSGPAGLVTNPKRSPETMACEVWLRSLVKQGHEIVLPEIIDYEIRRELIRARKPIGLKRLDQLKADCTFLEVDSATFLKAAEFWADARWRGQPTANVASLDIDVILAAQSWMYRNEGEFSVIATLNKKHLSQFVPAEHWKDIHPV
jgi:predicted nucleic acid-binding protein